MFRKIVFILGALFVLASPLLAGNNIALNQPTIAGTTAINYPAKNAVDGTRNTLWMGTRFPDWIKVSFTQNKIVDQYIIKMPFIAGTTSVAQELSVDYSLNGTTWFPLHPRGIVSFYFCDGSKTNPGACSYPVSLGQGNAKELKYFRVNLFRRWRNGILQTGGQIGDLEIYGF